MFELNMLTSIAVCETLQLWMETGHMQAQLLVHFNTLRLTFTPARFHNELAFPI